MIHVSGSVQRGRSGWGFYLGGEGLAGVPAVGRRGGAGAVLIPAVLGRARDARQHPEAPSAAARRWPMDPRAQLTVEWNSAAAPARTQEPTRQ